MALVTKPDWWSDFAEFYGFSNNSGTTIDSAEILREVNRFLLPDPTRYSSHLKATQGSASSTAKLDFIVLSGASDFVAAQSGSDYISAKAGDDIIYGDAGSDIVRGGAGADLIIGSNEANNVSDRDTVSYRDATAAVTVILNSNTTFVSSDGHGSYDLLIGMENAIGSDFDDRIDGQDGIDNTIIGGLGADRLYGGSGNDILVGDDGIDRLYGEAGNDVFISGKGRDLIFLSGGGQDRIIIDAANINELALHRDSIYTFSLGAGGDKLDVSALLKSVGYAGSNPVADGYIKLSISGGDDIRVQFDADGSGGGAAQDIAILVDVPLSGFSIADNLVYQGPSILYAAILGQSNAKGLSTAGPDGESGVTRLQDGLDSMTNYNEIISVLRDGGTPIDLAVGGTTVDGNRNTSYMPDQVWWYPDENRPGEVLLRAVDLMALQIADMRARGVVTPVVIWGQGEAETRLLGRGPNHQEAVDRYIQATYDVFDYIKARLGDDIQFYIMETGRYNVDAARIAGESEREIQQVLKGLELLRTAQQDMAIDRADIHLAANYSDLRMLHESDPATYPTDVWHMDYDDREIIGDRLAAFIAADMGFNHVITNPGPYPVRALADLTIHAASEASGPNIVNGTSGDDILKGSASGSIINGEAGSDRLTATGGANILIGGLGKDSIIAGPGQDTIVFGANLLPDVSLHSDFISNFQGGQGGDKIDISGLLSAVGYAGSDPVADGYFKLIVEGTRTKFLFDADGNGGSGARYMGALANVTNFSVEHNLIIKPDTASPSANGLEIVGTSNPDLIIGTLGEDRIEALAGADMIVGGAGSDLLYGGSGIDDFIFDTSVWNESFASSGISPGSLDYADIIEDFTTGAGGDRINIEILLEKAGYTGSDPAQDGYVRVTQAGSDSIFEFDADGNGAAHAVALALLQNVNAASFDFDDNLGYSRTQMVV